RLKLSGYNNFTLRQFPKILFQTQTLRDSLHDVILSDLQFRTLPTGAFKDMSQIRLIEISLCSRIEIQTNTFDNLPRLEKIVMTKNNIPRLPRMFRNVPSLREIYFEDNNISTFERGVFESLKNLNYLTLDNNKIHTLSSYYFDGLTELNTLELRYNQIKHLPS
ncbi:leucine-rich transmembrane protein, partial [Euroglyphus maynei]